MASRLGNTMSEILGKYTLGELLAVGWDAEMAQRFPNADHTCCRVQVDRHGNVVRCAGLHCNRCGQSTDCQGGHDCPDRPDWNTP